MNLSNAYMAGSDFSHAESLLHGFLQSANALQPEQKAAVMEELGTIAVTRGKLAEAEQVYRKSLEAFLISGTDQERVVIILSNLAVVSAKSGYLPISRC